MQKNKKIQSKSTIKSMTTLFITGAVLGIASKLLDIYTTNIGNMFSELSIWILFGVLISIYSINSKRASANVFSFCFAMIITYYITAIITNSVYSKTFIYGWSIFTLFSPLFAYITWYSKEKNIVSKIISIGIIIITILASFIIFDGLRVYDYIIILILIYFLFFRKVNKKL